MLGIAAAIFLLGSILQVIVRWEDERIFPFSEKYRIFGIMFIVAVSLGTSVTMLSAHEGSINFLFFPPWDDRGYYFQLLNYPFKGLFDPFNSRRPLNAMINILEFQIAGRGVLTLMILRVNLLVMAVSALVMALSRKTGLAAALSAGFMLIVWAFPFASRLMSEVNGMTAAAAGLACILSGEHSRGYWKVYIGLFLLCLAYLLRPFNPLMPALMALVAFFPLKMSTRAAFFRGGIAAFGAILCVWILPSFLALYSHPGGTSNANLAYTILGITRGTTWSEAGDYQNKTKKVQSEAERSAVMYDMALKNIREHPEWAVNGIMKGVRRMPKVLLQEVKKGLGLGLSTPSSWEKNKKAIKGSSSKLRILPVIFIVIFLICVLIISFLIKRNSIISWIFGISLFSFVSVAPILITSGGWRIVASLFPGLSLMLAIIPTYLRERRLGDLVEGSQASPAIFQRFPEFILFFIILAIPFSGIYRMVAKKQIRKPYPGLEVRVVDDGSVKWLGINEVQVSLPQIIQVLSPEFYSETRMLLQKEGAHLYRIQFSDGHPIFYFRKPFTGAVPTEQDIQFRFPASVGD